MADSPNNEDSSSLQAVLDALGDPDCRDIITEASEPMTANELSETCNISQSTVYRKLNRLSEASLVREQVEINPDGGRVTRYRRNLDDLTISVDDDQFEFVISRPPRTMNERLETIWSKLGEEL